MFRVQHLERAVAARYPGRRPRGLVGHLVTAAAAALSLSTDRVRRLWKDITGCREGHCDRVFRRGRR